jgi:Resolvase, N terminal domain
MARLQLGDLVLVTRIDRLGRSVRESLDLIDRIDKAGAKFRSVGDPLLQLLPDAVVPSKEELAAYFNVKALPRHGGYVNLNLVALHAPRRAFRCGRNLGALRDGASKFLNQE